MGTHNLIQTLIFFALIAILPMDSNSNFIGETTKKSKVYHEIRKNELMTSLNFEDMPQEEDMTLFMDSINKVVDFCTKFKEEMTRNLAMGLFLINVNLKKVLKYKSKYRTNGFMDDVQKTVEKNNKLLQYFDRKTKKDTKAKNDLNIYSLFDNDTQWVERLPDMNVVIESRQSIIRNVLNLNKSWKTDAYLRTVFDSFFSETARQSDKCLGSMAANTHRQLNITQPQQCKFDYTCYDQLLYATDAGYSITHRLLWVIMSHFGRGCVVFSPAIDKKITKRLCTTIFSEAQIIARLRFPIIDLLLEQVAFCALVGHAEFLKRGWLQSALTYQTDMGCFQRNKLIQPLPEWMMTLMDSGEIGIGGLCDLHLTATAGAAISSAVRYQTIVYKYI